MPVRFRIVLRGAAEALKAFQLGLFGGETHIAEKGKRAGFHGDPTHGGKLTPTKKTTSGGVTRTYYTAPEAAPAAQPALPKAEPQPPAGGMMGQPQRATVNDAAPARETADARALRMFDSHDSAANAHDDEAQQVGPQTPAGAKHTQAAQLHRVAARMHSHIRTGATGEGAEMRAEDASHAAMAASGAAGKPRTWPGRPSPRVAFGGDDTPPAQAPTMAETHRSEAQKHTAKAEEHATAEAALKPTPGDKAGRSLQGDHMAAKAWHKRAAQAHLQAAREHEKGPGTSGLHGAATDAALQASQSANGASAEIERKAAIAAASPAPGGVDLAGPGKKPDRPDDEFARARNGLKPPPDQTLAGVQAQKAAEAAPAGKSVKLSGAASGEFDMLREQHADPEGHGLDDNEREAVGHLVSHHDPDRGHLRLPDDPEVAEKMAGHVGALASSYGDQIQDKTGEASHADGRVHMKRAMGALEGLRDTLNTHAQGLRPKAATGAADTKRQEHEQKAAGHAAEAAKLPAEDPVGVKHREAADAHEKAARWHGKIGTVGGAERAAAMLSEQAHDRTRDVETVAARMKGRDDQRLKEDPAFQAAQTAQAARAGSPAPSANPHSVIGDKHAAQQAHHAEMAGKTAGAGKTMHLDAAAAHGAAAAARHTAAGGGYSEGLAAKQASDHADQITKQTARLPQPGAPGTASHFGHQAAFTHERRARLHGEAEQAFGAETPEGKQHRKAKLAHRVAADANKAAATGGGPEDKAREATASAHALSEGIEHNDPATYHAAQAREHKKAAQGTDTAGAAAHMKAASLHEAAAYAHNSPMRTGDKMRAASQAARDASAKATEAQGAAPGVFAKHVTDDPGNARAAELNKERAAKGQTPIPFSAKFAPDGTAPTAQHADQMRRAIQLGETPAQTMERNGVDHQTAANIHAKYGQQAKEGSSPPANDTTAGKVARSRYNQDTGHVRAYMDEAVRPHVESGPGDDADSKEDHRKAKLALDHYDPDKDGFRKPKTAQDAHDLADTLEEYGRAEAGQASDSEERADKVFHGRAGQRFQAHAEEMRGHAKSLDAPKPMHMQTQDEATEDERKEFHRRRNMSINDAHGLRGGGGKRSAGKAQGGFSARGFSQLQKAQQANSPLDALDAVDAKKQTHKVAVRDALRSGELKPEDYQRLHGSTYGDPEALKQHKTAEESNTERMEALKKRDAAVKAAAQNAPPKPRNPTLAQIHKEQGVAPERAKKERELWANTHPDSRGYHEGMGHTVMGYSSKGSTLQPIRSMSDAELDEAHGRIAYKLKGKD